MLIHIDWNDTDLVRLFYIIAMRDMEYAERDWRALYCEVGGES